MLDKFKVAFVSLLFLAGLTSAFAGLGLVTSIQVPGELGSLASAGAQTTSSGGSTHSAPGVNSISSSTALSSTSTTGGQTTTTTTATSTTTLTATATTTTSTTTVASAATTTVEMTTTSAAGANAAGISALGSFSSSSQGESLLREVESTSLFLAPVCWLLLGGAWIWRGRMRSRWMELGFGSDVFELFMKMKGGTTRIKVLNTLTTPKDRLQLAEQLGVDWKTVDRHVQILNKYGFVREQSAYGTVKLYEVTPMGKMLLNLFDDLERTDGLVVPQDRSIEGRSEKNF